MRGNYGYVHHERTPFGKTRIFTFLNRGLAFPPIVDLKFEGSHQYGENIAYPPNAYTSDPTANELAYESAIGRPALDPQLDTLAPGSSALYSISISKQ